MAEFKTIETQEELDRIITERLNRQKTQFDAEIQKRDTRITELEGEATKYSGYAQEKADMEAKIARYETDSAKREIADEYGLPKGFYKRLQGNDAKAWKEDAAELKKFIGGGEQPLAGYDPKPTAEDKRRAALKKMITTEE